MSLENCCHFLKLSHICEWMWVMLSVITQRSVRSPQRACCTASRSPTSASRWDWPPSPRDKSIQPLGFRRKLQHVAPHSLVQVRAFGSRTHINAQCFKTWSKSYFCDSFQKVKLVSSRYTQSNTLEAFMSDNCNNNSLQLIKLPSFSFFDNKIHKNGNVFVRTLMWEDYFNNCPVDCDEYVS